VKGIEYVLRALAILKKQYPNLRYVVAGDGPLRERLEVLTKELGLGEMVIFMGSCSQEDIALMYQAAHGFVLAGVVTDSGEEEGQSVVLAEAEASGLPVIATAVGGIPESMCNGESGLLVPPRNPQALASAIEWLVEHPEECLQMGYAGRIYVEDKFDIEKSHNQLIDVYLRLKEKPTLVCKRKSLRQRMKL
jgi:glycosyltransferase involved in cell wall biosynthesis